MQAGSGHSWLPLYLHLLEWGLTLMGTQRVFVEWMNGWMATEGQTQVSSGMGVRSNLLDSHPRTQSRGAPSQGEGLPGAGRERVLGPGQPAFADRWHAERFVEWNTIPVSFEPGPLEAGKGRAKNV